MRSTSPIAEKINILFTCAGRRVVLIESFRNAMSALGVSGKVVVTEMTPSAAACHVADECVIVGPVREDGYISELLKAVKKHSVGLLVPLTDLDLMALAENRGRFEELGCVVMIASPEVVASCRDKFKTNELVAKAGLEPIRTCTVDQFIAHPFYPCFVKPVEGSAAFGASRINDAHELRVHLATYGGPEMMVQEYITGQEFTIDVYRSRNGEICSVVPRQRLQVRGGEVQKGVTVKDEAVMAATEALASEMNDIWGVFCCQCRRVDADSPPRFFEINPRFGGGAPLAIEAGANLPLYLLQDVLGKKITGKAGEFTEHLLMLRYDDAVFHQVDDIASLDGYETPEFR